MLRRLWLLLLCLLAAATAAGPAAARPSAARPSAAQPSAAEALASALASAAEAEALPERAPPVATIDATPLAGDLLAAGRAELTTVIARVLPTRDTAPDDAGARAAAGGALRERRAAGWCDVVQCRRWSGAQLLRYATPPPARA